MKFSAKQYAKALMEALETTAPAEEDKVLDNFVNILAENNDLRLHDAIAEEFHKLELAKKGISQVNIKSASPLSKNNEKAILDELNKLAKTKFELKKEVDERLIGGVIIEMEDQVIDASVKNQLEQLKNNLSN